MPVPPSLIGRLRSLAARSTAPGGLFLSRVYAQLVQFGFFLVVARFLDVAEFGVFSLLFAVALGLSLIAEGGWREYLICHDDDALVRRAYGLALTVSTGIFLLIAAGAAIHWSTNPDSEIGPTMLALAAWIPVRSFCTLESGRLTKAGRLHDISVSSIVSETAGCVAGLAALWAGMGILALGISKLGLQLAALACLSLRQERAGCEWRRQPQDRAMMQFASQILIGRFAAFLSGNFSVFVIGAGLNATGVGFYRAATRIAGAAAEALREPARVVFWSALKRDSGQEGRQMRLRRAEDSAWYLLGIAAPLFVAMAVLSEPLIAILLGDKWLPAAPIMSILAISYLIGLVTTLSEPVFSLDNQPERARRLALFGAVMSGVAVTAAIPFGLYAVAWAQLIASALMAVFTLWSLHTHGGMDIGRLLRRLAAPALGTAAMIGALWFLDSRAILNALPDIVRLAALGVAGLAVYSGVAGVVMLRALRGAG